MQNFYTQTGRKISQNEAQKMLKSIKNFENRNGKHLYGAIFFDEYEIEYSITAKRLHIKKGDEITSFDVPPEETSATGFKRAVALTRKVLSMITDSNSASINLDGKLYERLAATTDDIKSTLNEIIRQHIYNIEKEQIKKIMESITQEG